jgi:hypothetical protein
MSVIADNYFPEFQMPGVLHYEDSGSFFNLVNDIMNGNIDKLALVKEGRNYIRETLHIDLLNRKRWEILKGI